MDSPVSSIVLAIDKHNKSRLAAGLAVLLLGGCAGHRPVAPPLPQVQVVEARAEAGLPGPELIQGLAAAQLLITDYPVPGHRREGWRYRLRRAEALAGQGLGEMALEQLRDLQAEVSAATRDYVYQQALRYLGKLEQFALLRGPQRDRLRAVQFAAARQDWPSAYTLGRALYRELWSAQGWVTVRPGDTLAAIAARPEVFDNPNLWPLLQQANKGLVRDPRRLKAGWRLRYPVHPQLDEIFQAVKQATDH